MYTEKSTNIYLYKYLNRCNYTITYFVDYYKNTIDDMQNEKNFFYHCNEFEYILYFVKF